MQSEKISQEQARNLLWKKGQLKWLLRPHQKDLYDNYYASNEKILVWLCSRRLGKSYSLCLLAVEECLNKPGTLVRYCCPRQKDAREIIRPLITEIIDTCPDDLRPEYKTQENAWVFKNGARITVTGLDGGRADSIRGGAPSLVIIDEAGFVDKLSYAVGSVILPATGTTKGKIILSSTPSVSPTHEFIQNFVNPARIRGTLIVKTIYDNKYFPPDELQKIIEVSGGVDSIDFQREYLCKIIVDDRFAIIPEFGKVKEKIVKEWEKAKFYDAYVSMDVGMTDLTVVLFGWFDFINNKLIIEDELVVDGQQFNTEYLAQGIKIKESKLFKEEFTGDVIPPYLRVSDNNLIVIRDLWALHGLQFIPTEKDDAAAALNKVRIMIQNEQIIINPRCKTLIGHLETGIWNKQRTSFARSGDNGHFDAIDSLKYMVRNVQFSKNPYPANFFNNYKTDAFGYKSAPNNQSHEIIKKLFKMGAKN